MSNAVMLAAALNARCAYDTSKNHPVGAISRFPANDSMHSAPFDAKPGTAGCSCLIARKYDRGRYSSIILLFPAFYFY